MTPATVCTVFGMLPLCGSHCRALDRPRLLTEVVGQLDHSRGLDRLFDGLGAYPVDLGQLQPLGRPTQAQTHLSDGPDTSPSA